MSERDWLFGTDNTADNGSSRCFCNQDVLERLDRIIQLLTPEMPPHAVVELPDRCAGIADGFCALRSEDARISRASFTDPLAWKCKGCRVLYQSV